jgi:curli biogenesis system outer membrane secretion channel CsgG
MISNLRRLPVSRVLRVTCSIATLASLTVTPAVVLAQVVTPGVPGIEKIRPRTSMRIAVLDFDFSSIGLTGAVYAFAGGAGPAKAVSTLLTNQLVKDGTYVMIERSKIDAVLAEQNLAQSGRIEPTTAAQIGRVLGVDAVVIGSVTQFGLEKKRGGFSFGGLGQSSKKQTARVQVAARMVSTTTGEILAIAEGSGEATQKDESLAIGGFSKDDDSDAADRLLATAADQALGQVSTQLVAVSSKLSTMPAVLPLIEPLVADVSGGTITLNKGGRDGLRPGMVLQIERVVRAIRDPATGKVLRRQTQPLGRVQLIQVNPEFSVGRVLRGGGFRVGDVAKAVE